MLKHGQRELLEIVLALRLREPPRAACTAGNNSADQNADDRNHDQQFNQGKTPQEFQDLAIFSSYEQCAIRRTHTRN